MERLLQSYGKVNEGIEDKIGTPDPALPGKYITDRLQADHIVSIKI